MGVCAYCKARIRAEDRTCPSCGAAVTARGGDPREAATPQLNFGRGAVAALAGSLVLGGLGYLTGPENPPLLVMFLMLIWAVPCLPALLVLLALRDARAAQKGPVPGIVIALMVWLAAVLVMFLPVSSPAPPT
ncbi:MAG: hypothetical protein AAGD12_18205 [Pseudomonadota bacterium]